MHEPRRHSNFHQIRSSFESRSKSTSSTAGTSAPLYPSQLRLRKSVNTNIMTAKLDGVPDTKRYLTAETSQKPSRIGPRYPSLAGPAMAQKVKITFSSPGLTPPVFITSSLTDPQWVPTEMSYSQDESGSYEYFKVFEAVEGHYQYKFRLGNGDWWVFDDNKPSVDDGFGNKNNLLVVEPKSERDDVLESQVPASLQQHEANATSECEDKYSKPTPKERPVQVLNPSPEDSVSEIEQAPLLQHEKTSSEHDTERPTRSSLLDMPEKGLETGAVDIEEVLAPEPSQTDQTVLEKFPEDQTGIMESIRKLSSIAPAGEIFEQPEGVTSRSRAISSSSVTSSSLPSEKEHINEEPKHKDSSKPVKPLVKEESAASRPAEPITPPMTPKDEDKQMHEDGASSLDGRVSQSDSSISPTKSSVVSSARNEVVPEETKQRGYLAAFLGLLFGVGHWFSRLCGGRTNAT